MRAKSIQQDNTKESLKDRANQRIEHISKLYLSLCYEELQTFYRNTKANNKFKCCFFYYVRKISIYILYICLSHIVVKMS